jgi:hypothetical protein
MEIWREKGYELMIVAREKDVTLPLMDHYGYEYSVLSKARRGIVGLAIELLEHESRLLWLMFRKRPDVVLEVAGTFVVHAATLLGIPALVFSDTEHARLQNAITYPFATRIITPACYPDDLGEKHVRYNGYQELAYLHPDYFRPDPSIRDDLGLQEGEAYSVLRFVSWDASHDRGHAGMPLEGKRELVARLAKYGRVIISSEAPLAEEFEPYRVTVSPHRMHDLLAFANLYVGEGATMASEAAILGTPAVYISSIHVSTLEEQESLYGMVFNVSEPAAAISKAEFLFNVDGTDQIWAAKHAALLASMMDVTKVVCDEVEQVLVGQAAPADEPMVGQATARDGT